MLINKENIYQHWTKDQEDASKYISELTSSFGITDQIISIEKSSNTVLNWMDIFAGCDWIGKTKDNQIYGIAVRIQWINNNDNPYNTFTIRYQRYTNTKTEYQKRIESIQYGYIYPKLTLQAYYQLENNKLLSAALIKTINLYEFCEKYSSLTYTKESDNVFKYIKWKDLKEKGYKIIIL